jgi:hypothetical protein
MSCPRKRMHPHTTRCDATFIDRGTGAQTIMTKMHPCTTRISAATEFPPGGGRRLMVRSASCSRVSRSATRYEHEHDLSMNKPPHMPGAHALISRYSARRSPSASGSPRSSVQAPWSQWGTWILATGLPTSPPAPSTTTSSSSSSSCRLYAASSCRPSRVASA